MIAVIIFDLVVDDFNVLVAMIDAFEGLAANVAGLTVAMECRVVEIEVLLSVEDSRAQLAVTTTLNSFKELAQLILLGSRRGLADFNNARAVFLVLRDLKVVGESSSADVAQHRSWYVVVQIQVAVQSILHCVREVWTGGVWARELLVALDGMSLDMFPQTLLSLCLESTDVAVEHLSGVPVFKMNLALVSLEMSFLREAFGAHGAQERITEEMGFHAVLGGKY